eukprot:UN14603
MVSNVVKVAPASPRTPRTRIVCRHCDGAHWSHRCPNRSKKNSYTIIMPTIIKNGLWVVETITTIAKIIIIIENRNL